MSNISSLINFATPTKPLIPWRLQNLQYSIGHELEIENEFV